MDRHGHFEGLLGPYLLEALEPTEEREVERHLIRCPRCRRETEGLFGVHRLLMSIEGEVMTAEPPSGLKARVLGRLSGRGHPDP